MKILYIKLVNFIGIHAARGLSEIEYDFSKIEKPIIQLFGPNRSGKTVLIQQLHPFSSINLNGDDRSDLSLILPHEYGLKNIIYEFNGDVYNITHTYKPTSSGMNHTVTSSLKKNDEELNTSGGVNMFNALINNIFGINRYTFQFVINGTNLMSFASMSNVQRKNILNKSMGIDIYDKIHKMSTDDYRYTNKLITSLNNTKEFVLSTYGSVEALVTELNMKQNRYNELDELLSEKKSRMDILSGQISTLRSQNIDYELNECNRLRNMIESAQNEIGVIDDNTYDTLVNEQIKLNSDINDLKSRNMIIMKDIDDLYAKKEDIENTIKNNRKLKDDYDNMIRCKDDLTKQISNINIDIPVESSPAYYSTMLSVSRMINSISQEIATCLNQKHLSLLCDMILKNVDVSAFLIQEGTLLMNSENEKSVVMRIQSMINTIDGDAQEKCECKSDCMYWRTYDTLSKYFKMSQSSSDKEFSQYDLELFDHAYKNVLSIKKMINQSTITDELSVVFNLKTIMSNIKNGDFGIDISIIQNMMESATNLETRNRLISQLKDVEDKLSLMKDIVISSDDVNETLSALSNKITDKNTEMSNIRNQMDMLKNSLTINDRKRMLLSQIKHIKLNELQNRYQKYLSMSNTLRMNESEYNELNESYNSLMNEFNIIKRDLKTLTDAHTQYNNTMNEITKYSDEDNMYKIIAEATSSTKGKPVLAIRDAIHNALVMTNRLLDVMYDGELEMLTPEIDETHFSLPFRCGSNTSNDIKYGSQSESCLLSLAISLSLASSLTVDMVPLIDEIDAPLDMEVIPKYMTMLMDMLTVLGCDQCFVISHHFDESSEFVHRFDITQ